MAQDQSRHLDTLTTTTFCIDALISSSYKQAQICLLPFLKLQLIYQAYRLNNIDRFTDSCEEQWRETQEETLLDDSNTDSAGGQAKPEN